MKGGSRRGSARVLGGHAGDCRVSSGRAGVDEGRDEEEIPGSEGEEGGPGLP